MSYYAYFNDQPCRDCGRCELVQLSYDVTCNHCGLEQGYGNFVYDTPNYNNDDEILYPSGPTPIDPLTKAIDVPHDMFQMYAICVPVPDNVISAAKAMYRAYMNKRASHKDDDKMAFTVASIYFASRASTPISMKQLLAAIPSVTEPSFNDACSRMTERLGSEHEYKDVLFKSKATNLHAEGNTVFSLLKCIPLESLHSLKKKYFEVTDRLQMTPELSSIAPLNIATCVVFMAARSKDIKFKVKDFAKDVGISSATINNLQDKVKRAIIKQ